ncbi:GNAT family N-acetyltransferase [Erysipelothrix anatis]|uniref:GNAT family N-acetyltransferase n=1 Tax=Erysipelothrix anatis TaxID=2683713 RepID=UPI0013594AF8|nr:GNAT family N-acetyltransferase [Erysipelothrix anatis]
MKKLNQDNEAELRAFLAVEPHYNLFLIGDLDAFGFDDAIQTYYGDYKDGELVGVIFRFRDDSIHIYATEVQDSLIAKIDTLYKGLPFKRIMVTQPTMDLLGNHILPYIQEPRPTTMSVYTPNDLDVDTHLVQKLDSTYAAQIAHIETLAFASEESRDVDRIRTGIESGERVVYGFIEDGNVVTVASYVAQTEFSAMIVGVATLDSARNKGYATQVVKKLSDDLYAKGKQGVLFYDNPNAARIYEKMGYAPLTRYYMNDVKR